MLTLGICTDQHFGPEAHFRGKLRKLSHRAPELAAAFAARMREDVHPDFVVNLGDSIEDEAPEIDLERYRACLEVLRTAGAPLVNVAGNHDRYNLSDAEILGAWGRAGHLFESFDAGGVHLVVLACEQRKNDIIIEEAQLEWLENDLARNTLPTVVLMHQSAADQDLRGNRWFEGLPHICLLADRVRLREILRRHGRTLLVLNGHMHWNHVGLHDGIPYVTIQSLIENLDEDAPGRPAAAHAVVRVDPPHVHVELFGAERARYQFTA